MFHVKHFERLERFCDINGIEYDSSIDEKFYSYFLLLVEMNKVMNLTAITEQDEVETKHFIDSLAAVSFIRDFLNNKVNDNDQRRRVVDVGTGAGFPGLPLSFVLSDVDFLLADSLNKRIGFLQDVIARLDCPNVNAVHARAEELGHGSYRQSFDFCVSRAVADSAVLVEYCLPLVKVGGNVILYKSGDFREELDRADFAIRELGGVIEEVRPFQLFETDMQRSLVIISKKADTPEKYPRKAGKPAKMPLQGSVK